MFDAVGHWRASPRDADVGLLWQTACSKQSTHTPSCTSYGLHASWNKDKYYSNTNTNSFIFYIIISINIMGSSWIKCFFLHLQTIEPTLTREREQKEKFIWLFFFKFNGRAAASPWFSFLMAILRVNSSGQVKGVKMLKKQFNNYFPCIKREQCCEGKVKLDPIVIFICTYKQSNNVLLYSNQKANDHVLLKKCCLFLFR